MINNDLLSGLGNDKEKLTFPVWWMIKKDLLSGANDCKWTLMILCLMHITQMKDNTCVEKN